MMGLITIRLDSGIDACEGTRHTRCPPVPAESIKPVHMMSQVQTHELRSVTGAGCLFVLVPAAAQGTGVVWVVCCQGLPVPSAWNSICWVKCGGCRADLTPGLKDPATDRLEDGCKAASAEAWAAWCRWGSYSEARTPRMLAPHGSCDILDTAPDREMIHADDSLEDSFERASAEALAAFGDGRMFIEKLVEDPRHIEVQVLALGFVFRVLWVCVACARPSLHSAGAGCLGMAVSAQV